MFASAERLSSRSTGVRLEELAAMPIDIGKHSEGPVVDLCLSEFHARYPGRINPTTTPTTSGITTASAPSWRPAADQSVLTSQSST